MSLLIKVEWFLFYCLANDVAVNGGISHCVRNDILADVWWMVGFLTAFEMTCWLMCGEWWDFSLRSK